MSVHWLPLSGYSHGKSRWVGLRSYKRTYDLCWSRSEQRFARGADAWDFADDLPALKTRLTEYLLRAADSFAELYY